MRTHEQSRAHYSPSGANSRLELFIPISPTSSLLLTSAFTLLPTAAEAEKQKEQLRQIPPKTTKHMANVVYRCCYIKYGIIPESRRSSVTSDFE